MKLSTGLLSSLATLAVIPFLAAGAVTPSSTPSATVKNGTYIGKYDAEWDQDHFLGIPFAIPPVGPLRFARPKSLDTAFTGTRNATAYGYSCYQYSNPTFNLSEDCLTLNGRTSFILCKQDLTSSSHSTSWHQGESKTASIGLGIWWRPLRWFYRRSPIQRIWDRSCGTRYQEAGRCWYVVRHEEVSC
jgi:hypothetical protein